MAVIIDETIALAEAVERVTQHPRPEKRLSVVMRFIECWFRVSFICTALQSVEPAHDQIGELRRTQQMQEDRLVVMQGETSEISSTTSEEVCDTSTVKARTLSGR